jgi:hypothetical protein
MKNVMLLISFVFLHAAVMAQLNATFKIERIKYFTDGYLTQKNIDSVIKIRIKEEVKDSKDRNSDFTAEDSIAIVKDKTVDIKNRMSAILIFKKEGTYSIKLLNEGLLSETEHGTYNMDRAKQYIYLKKFRYKQKGIKKQNPAIPQVLGDEPIKKPKKGEQFPEPGQEPDMQYFSTKGLLISLINDGDHYGYLQEGTEYKKIK